MTLDLKGLKSYFEVNASILDGSSGVSKVMWGSKLVNTFGEPYKLKDFTFSGIDFAQSGTCASFARYLFKLTVISSASCCIASLF